ncbi:hypothetical protein DFR24_4037 [Panacagrimonas perspica]|uniref:Ig-like domain-containing protein n=1 Tax=Panacagrimonas perspica TaxID=381431 RepID=A0A4R7NWT3_9GAMM|nr:hypothetical protein [Panacagrimonas perspica]TDU25597.1 hypothetical protein DFR24_4037 [Panacagrimonas perspica]THD03805.1 hypothetical protein B1810_07990 [Panacagrimonas perspica]
MYFSLRSMQFLRATRPPSRRLHLQLTAAGCAALSLLMAPAATSSDEASRDPDALEFAIEGVGKGTFDEAVLAEAPAQSQKGAGHLCVTLAGGSRSNPPALLKWVGSNSAGAALATRPDATLRVPAARKDLEPGTYHLSGVTVRKFTQKSDRDLTHPRLAGVEVKCETITGPSA